VFEELSYPIIFAHRGASAHAPENTLASFELALSQGADAIELDANLSADGEVVSRRGGETIWSGSEFSSLRINPGDTIVIPEKTYKPSMLNSIMSWSQLASQLAMDSAMITVLK